MRSGLALTAVSAILVLGLVSCGGSPAKDTEATSLLRLLPEDATGVFFADVSQIMGYPMVESALEKNRRKVDQFVEETGIDPVRDISCLAGAIVGENKGDDSDGVVAVKLSCDPEIVLEKMRAKHGELRVEEYEGVSLVALPDESGNPKQAALLDNILVFGTPDELRATIDVYRKRARSVLENKELMSIVESASSDGFFWGAVLFSDGSARELAHGIPMGDKLSGLRSLVVSMDYRDNAFEGEIICSGADPQANADIADLLNGLKALGSMNAGKNPQLAQVLRSIDIQATPDDVRITATIPESIFPATTYETD